MTIQLYSKRGIPTGIVDDIDADLSQFNWGECGKQPKRYIHRTEKKVHLYIHRVIGERILSRPLNKGEEIDHINGDTRDNRRSNLRLATHLQNLSNRVKNKTNKSGYKSVYYQKGKWIAEVVHMGEYYYLGRHLTPELAHAAYCEKAKELFGEFFNAG